MLFGNPHTHNPHTQLSFLKQTTQSPLSHTPMFPSNLQKKRVYSNKHYSQRRHNSRQKPEMRAYYTDVSAYDRFCFSGNAKERGTIWPPESISTTI